MSKEVELEVLKKANELVKQYDYIKAREELKRVVNTNYSCLQAVVNLSLAQVSMHCERNEDSDNFIEQHLMMAVVKAEAVQDEQLLVAGHAMLAEFQIALGNKDRARFHRRKARKLFEDLPDRDEWPELNEMIDCGSGKLQNLMFLSCCPDCTTDDGNYGRSLGTGDCKRC